MFRTNFPRCCCSGIGIIAILLVIGVIVRRVSARLGDRRRFKEIFGVWPFDLRKELVREKVDDVLRGLIEGYYRLLGEEKLSGYRPAIGEEKTGKSSLASRRLNEACSLAGEFNYRLPRDEVWVRKGKSE